jgi:hypothetical protein
METLAEFKASLQAKHEDLLSQTDFRRGWINIPVGWHPLVKSLVDEISNILLNNPQITGFSLRQIKEKFGGLRVYTDQLGDKNNLIKKAIMEAEVKSVRICQECGSEGKERPLRWVRTLCNNHYVEALTDEKRPNQSIEERV